jgi:hypothetical protein
MYLQENDHSYRPSILSEKDSSKRAPAEDPTFTCCNDGGLTAGCCTACQSAPRDNVMSYRRVLFSLRWESMGIGSRRYTCASSFDPNLKCNGVSVKVLVSLALGHMVCANRLRQTAVGRHGSNMNTTSSLRGTAAACRCNFVVPRLNAPPRLVPSVFVLGVSQHQATHAVRRRGPRHRYSMSFARIQRE